MEAIRCKSSSQVSSQVMIPFGLLIVFLGVGVSIKNDLKEYQSNYPLEMGKHEYCVKLIVACNKLRDRVEKFVGSDEFGEDIEMAQEAIDDNLEKYDKLGCVPKGLTPSGLRSYWNLVAQWERQVHEMFLHQNLFAVVEEENGGRKIMVTFGKMRGWCPQVDDTEDTTTTLTTSAEEEESEEETTISNRGPITTTKKVHEADGGRGQSTNSADSCEVSGILGQWVRNEINGTLSLSSLTERFQDFEKLLLTTGHSCCPYKSVRDRVDIINDGVDILEDLQDLKPSEKKDYTDIKSDYRNLNRRLEHLKTGNANYSTGKCCPAFLNHLNSFKNSFQSTLKDFSPRKSNITLKDLLNNAATLGDTCSEQQNQLKETLQSLNNKMNKTDNTCCSEEQNKIKLIENSLKELRANDSQQDLSKQINALRENLAETNKTLSDTENLIGLEAKQIDKLKAECGKVSQMQRSSSLIDSLSSNVSNLVDKLYDMEFIRTVDLSTLNTSQSSVNKMATMYSSASNNFQNVARTIQGIEFTGRTMQDKTEKCMQDIETLKRTFKRVNLENSEGHVFHELYQVAAKEIFQKYRNRHENLKESVTNIVDSPTELHSKSDTLPDINKVEKNLVNLKDIELPKLALNIKKRKKETADKVDKNENLKNIALFKEEIKKKKAQILERLDKLSKNKSEEPIDEDSEKMRQLEELISQLSDRHASLAKRIADRHEVLQKHVNEMSKRIAKASSTALSCPLDCAFDDLPTVDALAKRVKVLESRVQSYIKKKGKY